MNVITHEPCYHIANSIRKAANISCGIILKSKKELRYLIVQGPVVNGRPGIWSIPKGHPNASKEVLEVQGPFSWYTKTEDSEYNECAQCCAIRELEEETGIKVSEKDFKGGSYLRRYFIVETEDILPVVGQKDEVINYKWATISELRELMPNCNSDLKRFINFIGN
jgi:8-oxo-dGTP pyrophosphatase MutT (NUDIX family)